MDEVDAIDDGVDAADRALYAAFLEWMAANAAPDSVSFSWHFLEKLNHTNGIFQFAVASNHRGSVVWDVLQWIADNGPGSYGLFYVHDDEDLPSVTCYGRGQQDFSNHFRVHRIANGQLTKHADPFLSPICPTIIPSDLA